MKKGGIGKVDRRTKCTWWRRKPKGRPPASSHRSLRTFDNAVLLARDIRAFRTNLHNTEETREIFLVQKINTKRYFLPFNFCPGANLIANPKSLITILSSSMHKMFSSCKIRAHNNNNNNNNNNYNYNSERNSANLQIAMDDVPLLHKVDAIQ